MLVHLVPSRSCDVLVYLVLLFHLCAAACGLSRSGYVLLHLVSSRFSYRLLHLV